MPRAKKQLAPRLPSSHLEAMQQAGFEAITYGHTAIQTLRSDGCEALESLPLTIINWEKRQIAQFVQANDGNYAFAGWEPSYKYQFGGRYDTVQGALGWFAWIERQC